MCSIVAVPLFFFLLGLKGLVERLSDDNIEETKKKKPKFILLCSSFLLGAFLLLNFCFLFILVKGPKELKFFPLFIFCIKTVYAAYPNRIFCPWKRFFVFKGRLGKKRDVRVSSFCCFICCHVNVF